MAERPVAIVCVGMAGSGKTTFMQRINSHLHAQKSPPYVINLDPAVVNVPFGSNIDIRDSVNYKEVMKQYNLGPNGGILTSLNLFATKIDQVLALLEKRAAPPPPPPTTAPSSSSSSGPAPAPIQPPPIKHILIDTPGQIEVFVWSASGQIVLESLASSFPTLIAYIIDTPRTTSTSTFMSNMLYACSILYKMKLPMILVFNKTDVADAGFASEWMTDFEAFKAALDADAARDAFGGVEGGVGGGSGFMGDLLNSMSLVLEEFYRHLRVVGCSAMTGQGVDEFFAAVAEKADEFRRDYQPALEEKRRERKEVEKRARERELEKLMRGMAVTSGGEVAEREREKEDDDGIEAFSGSEDTDDVPDAMVGEEGLQERFEGVKGGTEDSVLQQASFLKYLHTQ